ncbi:MAG TPA: HypC/HybG/HupF family hydrogenase formation chaperone [Planctomycetota bacterium]|nr:HypC/HybG/HupF family hydrogenase formation chaperone [Planctomycetota bacterium]
MCLAVPGRVVEVFEEHDLRMGRVDFNGVNKKVCLAHVPEAGLGDYVLVHVGHALSRVDPAEAARVFAFLESLGELRDLEEPSP